MQENTLNLTDRTSREGMLETQAFRDLSELVRTIVTPFLENQVRHIRDQHERLKRGPRLSLSDLNRHAQATSQLIGEISARYDFASDTLHLSEVTSQSPRKALEIAADTPKELLREIEVLHEQADALTEAAGYGIAIAVAVHEIEKVTSNLYFGLERLSKKADSLQPEIYDESRSLLQTSQSLLHELQRLAPLRVTRLERPREFSVRDAVLAASGAFQLAWKELGIAFFTPPKEGDFKMSGSFGACSQVFANLLDNATYWLRNTESTVRHIMVTMDSVARKVVVADNGPGIDEKIRPHLFELYYSLRNPPSGLGLYICRYYMRQMKGDIQESSQKEKLIGFSGAHFAVTFPKLKEEEEE